MLNGRLLLAALPLAVGCRAAPVAGALDPLSPPDEAASPQAKAEPAPIASPPTAPPRAIAPPSASVGASIAIVATPLRADEPPPPDAILKETVKEGTKELPPTVLTLTFALRSSDVAPLPKGIELADKGVEVARRASEPTLAVDLTPGHARITLGVGFVLPEGTELRSRDDRYGYVVVAPDGASYRVGSPGSLRAILGEGLYDVAPSSLAEVVARGEGAKHLGKPTRRIEVTTRAAKGTFDLARVPELGDSGVLFCRMLLDLMSAGPATPVCVEDDLPLRLELRWSAQPARPTGRGRVSGVTTFDATELVRRTDVLPASFLAPPPAASFVRSGEPVTGARLFLARADLAGLRSGGPDPAARGVLSLHNSTDELRYVWLDGIPIAWLAPGGRLDVPGIPHVRAGVQWRTFLGDAIDQGETVTLPTMVDAVGAPPPTSGDSPRP